MKSFISKDLINQNDDVPDLWETSVELVDIER